MRCRSNRRPNWLLPAIISMVGTSLSPSVVAAEDSTQQTTNSAPPSLQSQFDLKFDAGAIVGLRRKDDSFDTQYIQEGRRLGDVLIQFRQPSGDWQPADTTALAASGKGIDRSNPDGHEFGAAYRVPTGPKSSLLVTNQFAVEDQAVVWKINLENDSEKSLEIGDLALPFAMNSQFRRAQPSSAVLKHSFVSGHGSFLFWMRPNSVGPYLLATPLENTQLEYWEAPQFAGPPDKPNTRPQRDFRAFIHSTVAGEAAKQKGCNWRQPHTNLTLAPKGQPGNSQTYGIKFQWANDYDAVRQLLVDDGLIDINIVPGMTVPSDLFAEIAFRSKENINAVEAEFPNETKIESLGARGDYQLYKVRFSKLGENRLTVLFGKDRHTYLEFFATEPLETLIKKRAAFIARSQHRDPSKWYNGLISDWNMESKVLLGPDNYDRISGFRIYEVSCDDPGLCKPAFLAAKSAEYPVQSEVEALDYYLKHFVWGGLQQTTDEPYPYAVYGIEDWKRNRDSDDPGRNGKRHIWRCYDYPHVVQMYFGMYRVAKNHPNIKTALSANEYLQRAYGTALAMFTVPLAVEGWSAYSTGFYNELIIVDIIDELEAAGMTAEAQQLREQWDKKVSFFAGGKADLFESEYPFDSTGFESTHAIARYAVQHAERSSPQKTDIPLDKAKSFMDHQIAANIFCRGYLEPAYYYLGSDYRAGAGNAYTLSYMSQMGGWSILDYGLNFASDPSPYLRLGYASYLSAWALMNTGTPESNYGYWYPGKDNDGGAGGGFEPAPFGRTWLEQPHHRGSWYYASEIDLGYCGALRTAATVLADDPIFDRFCFGGDWRKRPAGVEVVPKDGLRRRFHAMLHNGKLHLLLDSDRFVAGEPIKLDDGLTGVRFSLESENTDSHDAKLSVAGLADGQYSVTVDGQHAQPFASDGKNAVDLVLPIKAGGRPTSVAIVRLTKPATN
jgi:hypothetical protein